MITVGIKLETGEIIIRNRSNDTALIIDSDPDDLEMIIEMLIDELNDRHPDAEFMLESVETAIDPGDEREYEIDRD